MPKVEFKCNAKASLFAYPPALESKKKEENEKVFYYLPMLRKK